MATATAPASTAASSQVIRTGAGARFVIYTILAIFCLYYLLPLYVMAVNSLKPLSEIQAGGMMSLPQEWTLAPWGSAWSTAQIGVAADRPPAVLPELDPDGGPRRRDLDRARGAQRLRADQVALPRRHLGVRPAALRLLHPVPDGADPDGAACSG